MPENAYRRGKDGTWWARVKIDGQLYRRSLRTSNWAKARPLRDAFVKEIKRLTGGDGGAKHSWEETVLKYVTEVLPGAVGAGTAKRYKVSLKAVSDHFRPLFIEDITRRTIAEYIGKRQRETAVTNATIRRDLTAVSRVLQACVAWTWREDNPAREFDRSIVAENRLPRVLPTDEQIDAVEAQFGGNLARLWRFLLQSGMREEEAASLRHPQVKPGRGFELPRTKTNQLRLVPLDDKLMVPAGSTVGSTTRHLHCDFVFWHDIWIEKDGKRTKSADRYHNVASRLSRKIKALKFTFTSHDLRHRFAVDYLKRGGNIYNLQQILGHASLKTTELYLKFLTPEEKQRAKFGDHKREHNGGGLEHVESAAAIVSDGTK